MLETFNSRLGAAIEIESETGEGACPCVVFPEVSKSPEVMAVIDAAIANAFEAVNALSPAGAAWLAAMDGEAFLAHTLMVAAAAGYALALDTVSDPVNTFDVEDVDWSLVPDIDPMGDN